MPKFDIDYQHQTFKLSLDNQASISFDLKECPTDMIMRLAIHGVVQFVGSEANKGDDADSAFEYAEDAVSYIYHYSFPRKENRLIPTSFVIKAIACIKKISVEQARKVWRELPSENQEAIRKNKLVNLHVQIIKADQKLNKLTLTKIPKRKKFYEYELDSSFQIATLYFFNDKQISISIDDVKDVYALAIYGAKQKVADSFASFHASEDQFKSSSRVLSNLKAGIWSEKDIPTQTHSHSTLVKIVSRTISDAMKWQIVTVENVLNQFEQEELVVLQTDSAIRALTTIALEFSGVNKLVRLTSRDMFEILENVLETLNPSVGISKNG